MAISPLRKQGISACSNALKQIGFKEIKRSGSFQKEWTSETFASVGLNLRTSDLPVQFDVNPFIGVRHVEFDRVMHEISSDLPPGPLPSVGRQLGYLMPQREFRPWTFREGDDLEETAQSMVDAIIEYGQPYFEKYSDWSTFVAEVDSTDDIMLNMKARIIPIAWALNGEVAKAREAVSNERERVGQVENPYSVGYRIFSDNFEKKFGN